MEKVLYVGSILPSGFVTKYSQAISSNKFEKSMINQLNNKYLDNIEFLSVSNMPVDDCDFINDFKIDDKINISSIFSNRNLFLRIIKQTIKVIRYMINWCKDNKKYNKTIFMINSMPNISIPAYLVKLIFRCKIISFTIDTPLPYLKTKQGWKYQLSKIYYNIGLKLLNKFDGIILLNHKAYQELNLKIPYITVQIGFNPEDYSNMVTSRNNTNGTNSANGIITYAGSLVEYNGILNLISAFKQFTNKGIVLNIYGNGPLKDDVIKAAERNVNINYHGMVDNIVMLNILSESDIVINPRITGDEVCNYTFPSKLTEYMLCGAAVLTTKINSIPEEYYDYLYFIDDESSLGIADSILKVLKSSPEEKLNKYEMGKSFLYETKTWKCIMDQIDRFLRNI